jgi:redox-sensitive bicupin YhaK (pirin superfamily)
VTRIVTAIHTLEGAGFAVRRPFPTSDLDHLDPFLLLDEMGPADLGPGEAKGAPDHPHRGFETVTYMLAGRLEHRDSEGHAGSLGPGDVQWMTAGAGVIHSRMPEAAFAARGGRMHGFQLWVNLPRRDKLMPPRYQEVPAAQIPVVRTPDGRASVRVIAGESLGAKAVIDTRTPITYLHYRLDPGARVTQPVPATYAVFAYIFGGQGLVGREERPVVEGQMAMLTGDAEEVALASPAQASAPLDVLLIGGVPLREPVARYGPFVMNTRAEIIQAMDDYRAGRLTVR